MKFYTKHFIPVCGRLRNIGFWSVLSVLCLLGSGCSKDWNLDSYEADPLRELSLCIACPDEEAGFRLILDNGSVLLPEKKQSFPLEMGGRYRVHYAIRSHERDELFTAHIFEFFPIDLIPCVKEEIVPGKDGQTGPVEIERLWSAGGFLNLSFNCSCEGSDNQGHRLHYVRTEAGDGKAVLDFIHQSLKAGETTHSHTVSTPLDSIFQGKIPVHLSVNVLETANNNEVINTYNVF